MLIAKRHPMMKQSVIAERGIVVSYTLAITTALCSLVAASLLVGKGHEAPAAQPPEVALEFGPPVWVDAAPAGIEGQKAGPGAYQGAELSSAQPVYDEAAGVMIPAP